MGTRNSPGASGKLGVAFIRTVMETSDLFDEKAVDTSVKDYFAHGLSHPTYGEGKVLIGPDGQPEVLLCLHVDAILIHTPSLEKLEADIPTFITPSYVLDYYERLTRLILRHNMSFLWL